jgi:hypothetical protein
MFYTGIFVLDMLLLGLKNMSYLCIELSLSETDLLLQLKISHGLVDIDVGLKCQIVMYVYMTCNLVALAMIFSEFLLCNIRALCS